MKKQVTPHSHILRCCQVSQQTNVLGDTDLRYNVSVQSILILKAEYKAKNPQPAAQRWSLVWSKAQALGSLGSTLLLPCQHHEGRYRLNHSCILKVFSNLRCYLAHVNSESNLQTPAVVGRTRFPRSPDPLAPLSTASTNSQQLQLLQKYQHLAMLASLGPQAMLLSLST